MQIPILGWNLGGGGGGGGSWGSDDKPKSGAGGFLDRVMAAPSNPQLWFQQPQKPLGSGLGRHAGTAHTSGANTAYQPTAQPSLNDWMGTFNAFKAMNDAQNAPEWAALESRLQGLYREGGDRAIQANFASQMSGAENDLANQLRSIINRGGEVDDAAFANRESAMKQLYDILERGRGRDISYTNEQKGFINRLLQEAQAAAGTAREENQNLNAQNLRAIGGSFSGAGTYFSSAKNAKDTEENQRFGTTNQTIDQSLVSARRDYDKGMSDIQKRLDDLALQKDKNQLDLWNAASQLQTDRDKASLARLQAAVEAENRRKQAELAAQREQQQLESFYRGLEQQRNEANFAKWILTNDANAKAWFSTIAANGGPPPSRPVPKMSAKQKSLPAGAWHR